MQEPNQYRADRAAIREALVRLLDDVSLVHKHLLAGDLDATVVAASTLKTRGAAVAFMVDRIADNLAGRL